MATCGPMATIPGSSARRKTYRRVGRRTEGTATRRFADDLQNMSLKPYVSNDIIPFMTWLVHFHDEFELDELPEEIQDELLARLRVLSEFGPQLGRPNVDTLKGSSFPNMKELRFRKDGLWRFAFAFDSLQQAIVLVGGDKEGENQTKFYKDLIKVADARFSDHLRKIKSTLKKRK